MNLKIGAAAVMLAVVASGCIGSSTSDTSGDFELLISDAPAAIDDFDSLEVSFSEARVFRSSNESNESFSTINLDESRSVDLTQVKGANAQSLVNTSLESGEYSKIELYAADIGGVVNGSDVDVKIPPGKLMITKPFTVSPNSTTSFVFDIQVVLRGNQNNNQGYILKPVISESGVAGEDVEVERGKDKVDTEEEGPESPPVNQTE